ncbi:myomegalin isoform X2 [Heteronotia binoei]|uniref:myomegalin isoform X2 n=1 Tax=Heteronotia binoei TaxID=13085 RepID=UPI00292E94B0|nr:myomegalin isoform X2 [Heteronotia binoei]
MRESCRICGRELCGAQRRWLFHPAAKVSLQVLLSHVLGQEVSRDGRPEFACSKCAFMLERVYRYDTVVARIEALSLERLHKLLLEKERLKACLAGLYRKHNAEGGEGEAAARGSLPDANYAALLQEDFAYSGFEYWTGPEERGGGGDSHVCHPGEGGGRPRRCRGCAALRVADADYEAICKIPRKVARSVSCCPSSARWSPSLCPEDSPPATKTPLDGESLGEEGTPGSSVESLDPALLLAVAASPSPQRDEEGDHEARRGGKCEACCGSHGGSPPGNRLDVALGLVRAFDCKPVRSPKGSKLPVPVKSSALCSEPLDRDALAALLKTPCKPHSGSAFAFPSEMSDLQELWESLCEDYMPLQVKNSWEDQQQLTCCDSSVGKQASELNNAELLEKIHHLDANNKLLQEKLNEMDFELKSVQQTSQRQDHKIQNLNETLKSKETESEELYCVIEGQNETITKLQDILHRSQLGQLQVSESASSSQQKQQLALLELQNTLFLTQLEAQQVQRAKQQKDRQLAEEKRATQLLETWLQEEQQQKEAAWKHNWELRATLQQLQTKLQNKNWQCWTLEREKCSAIKGQEQKIKQLNYCLAYKEQLVQECKELLQYHQNLDKSPASAAADMVQKLQQRVKDRDAALEQAVDEKFHVLEEKEQELQQLRWSLREREHDLEGLHRILSNNETTIQGLESMLKAKGLELEQLSATCQNFQWLKEQVEAKSQSWQAEQAGIIQQLRTTLHERNKEVEAISAALQCKLGPGQRDIVEELCFRLQQKEQIIQELLNDKNRRVEEQKAEIQSLLQAVSARQQQSRSFSEKMAQALIERSCELQVLHQQLTGQIPGCKAEVSVAQLSQEGQSSKALKRGKTDENITTTVPKGEDGTSKKEKGVSESTAGLEKELSSVKDELELLARKERESRLELSALQSVVVSQEEELQVQASDVESLTRSIQIKEELIKDLQMQLVDPEEMPAVERLTQEVLMLREKVAQGESQRQEVSGNGKQQLLLLLEELAAEKNQLNEALQTEKQLYSTLVKFHAHPDSPGQEQMLQEELEGARALHKRLEEALGRTLERLLRLDSLDTNGVLAVTEDTEDASTEFTDSIEEEEAAHRAAQQQQQQNVKEDAADILMGHPSCPSPVSSALERGLHEELLRSRSETQQVLEQKKKLEEELQDLKRQIEDSGFSSVSHFRKALLSLCLENAELKEQIGEAMLSEGWENDDEKEEEKDPRPEVRKLQEKLSTAETVIGVPKEPLMLDSQGGEVVFKPHVAASMETKQQPMAKGLLPQKGDPHRLQPQCVDSDAVHTSTDTQVHTLTRGFWQHFMEPAQQLRSELTQCRRQCRDLQDKLLISETAVQARMAQLEHYQALLSDPGVQQDNKQVQVDLQDLGYETCGKSENEADREEATSPECEEDDVFNENSESWKKFLGSPPNKLAKQEAFVGCSQYDGGSALSQLHTQGLKGQLQSSSRAIQNPLSHGRSVSTSSDYASGAEHPLKLKQDYTLGSSPSHSMTDEDEGWHSDSLGSLCPKTLQSSKDLARLIQRVSLLEAHLDDTKPEELKHTASMGKYDSLVQAQARELSHLRQAIREGQGVSCMLSQHFRDATKSFEELLRDTNIDYFLGQSFREQLAQGNQLAGRLARKLSSRSGLNMEDKSGHELLALRLSKKLQAKDQIIKTLQAKLQGHSVTPSPSHTISEAPSSGSSTSFLSDGLDGCSDMEDVGDQETPREGQPCRHLDAGLANHSENASAPPSHPAPAAPPESVQKNFSLPTSLHPSQIPGQASAGFHPDSLSKPSSYPLAPCASGSSSFLPFGCPAATAPFLGCCGTPGFSLANAQQELQMLQKQLGESVPPSVLSPAKPELPAGLFAMGSPAYSSKHCPRVDHCVPRSLHVQQNTVNWNKHAGEVLGESSDTRNTTHLREPQKGPVCGSLPSCSSTCLTGPWLSGASLLQEHLAEIQILGQRLAESISTNNRLREQLEASLVSVARSNEWGPLQEALLASHSKLQDGEVELEKQQAEQQRLREEVRGKQQDLVQLREECLALQKDNSRLQHQAMLLHQQCEENQVLFQALQAELCVREVPGGSLQRADTACPRDGRSKGPAPSAGGDLLQEARALRNQLAQAVQVNCILQQQLEKQYSPGASPALQGLGMSFSASRWQHSQDSTLSPPVRDVGMNSSPSLFPLIPVSVPVLQANHEAQGTYRGNDSVLKNDMHKLETHVISHAEDYRTLKQQILEGKILVGKIASLLKSGHEPQDIRVFHPGGFRQLLASTNSLHQILEKAASLLSLFWIAVLPVPHISAQAQQAKQSMKEEIQVLRAKLANQESRLQQASHYKDSMENFLLAHLTRTHAVLKKARTNLEGISEPVTFSPLCDHVLA